MKRTILGLTLGLLAAVAIGGTADAKAPATFAGSKLGKILVGPNGKTLYTFAKDKPGEKSATCTGACLAVWPPLLASANAKPAGYWTLVNVNEGNGRTQKMWAYKGLPVYAFVQDVRPGQVLGENLPSFGAVWRVVNQRG